MTPAQVAHIMLPDLFPLLCQAWGESDRPFAFIAYTEAEVRKFIVNQWWGDETDERVDEVMSDLRGHDWKDEPEWHAEFEIGGVSFKPIYESNSRAAVEAALRDAPQQAEGWVMVPVDVLKAASESLGSFVSDHGWGDADMQAMDNLDAYLAARPSAPTAVEPDERRYQLLRRGQHWSVIDGVGNVLRGDDLDAAIDSILAARASKGTP